MLTWLRRFTAPLPDPAIAVAALRVEFASELEAQRKHTVDLIARERQDADRERRALIARYEAEAAAARAHAESESGKGRELVARLEGHVGMLTRNLEELTRQQLEQFGTLSAAQQQIADLTSERALLREQIAALHAEVERQKAQIAELLEERTQARNQAQQYRSMYEFVERESRERAAKIADLEAEVARLRDRIAELERERVPGLPAEVP